MFSFMEKIAAAKARCTYALKDFFQSSVEEIDFIAGAEPHIWNDESMTDKMSSSD